MPETPSNQSNFHGNVHNVITGEVGTANFYAGPAPTAPREGPSVRPDFVGRTEIIERIRAALRDGCVAVRGGTGIGKTATAAKLLDSLSEDEFPDGRVYVDLDGQEPTEAMHSLLIRLGTEATRIPASLEGKKPLYHSATRDRRMLVVVDGVAREREAALFRPVSPSVSYAVFTSVPLREPDYTDLELPQLETEEVFQFLRRACPSLSEADARTLAEKTLDRTPSALRSLAGALAQGFRPDLSADRGDAVPGGAELREAVFGNLSDSAKWLYRLLDALPFAEFESGLTGIFTGSRGSEHGSVPAPLAELIESQLVFEEREGWYRVERAPGARKTVPVPVELFSAARDSVAWHVRRAQLADRAVMGDRNRFAPEIASRARADEFGSSAQAMEWLRGRYSALEAVVHVAALHGWSDEAWALAEALWAFYANANRPDRAAGCYRDALSAATDPKAIAQLSSMLASNLVLTGEHVEAEQTLERGLAAVASRRDGDLRALESTLTEMFGRLRRAQARFEEALVYFDAARLIAVERGDRRAEAVQLRASAEVYQDLGRTDRALAAWTLAASVFAECGDQRNRAGSLLDAALCRLATGEAEAIDDADEAIREADGLGLWQTTAAAHEKVAAFLEADERLARLGKALALYRAHGAFLDADRVSAEIDRIS